MVLRTKITQTWVDKEFGDWINSENVSCCRFTRMLAKEKRLIKKIVFDKDFNEKVKHLEY